MLLFNASSPPSSSQENLSTSLNQPSDTSVLSSQLDKEAAIRPSYEIPFSIRRAHLFVANVHAYNAGMRDSFKPEDVDALRHYIQQGLLSFACKDLDDPVAAQNAHLKLYSWFHDAFAHMDTHSIIDAMIEETEERNALELLRMRDQVEEEEDGWRVEEEMERIRAGDKEKGKEKEKEKEEGEMEEGDVVIKGEEI
ncbi:hypothetical protein PTTG_07521 [Puccinia triticina 1-1 BBBD Race 1]|uniref:Uncharacterized protein n=1 Tax=Puccinia triticina (isolate 1-1 / race 1 (BBBD)) TaxID=630390 RepID=A0A0C4F347_PUCT1|nr:hypothetical protein PTTG_07521 [Puccinia triticina 1-1 BBBD Race 1]